MPENFTLPHVIEALEAQASRISQAIHDESGQLLTLAYLQLARAERAVSPECAVHLAGIRPLFDGIERQLRRISHELRPHNLEEYGLISALEFLVNSVAERTGLKIGVQCPHELAVPDGIDSVLYRFCQEALTNVARHAEATAVNIIFRQTADELICTVSDNGVGFDVTLGRSGMGLSGMRKRIQATGGTFSVFSQPGSGTELSLLIPFRRQSGDTSRNTCG